MGNSSPKWKSENVPDHKFDYVDVQEYRSLGIRMKLYYVAFHLIVLKSILILLFDLYTAGSLLAFNHWSMMTPTIPLSIARWIFAGSILLSLLLLLWDGKKAIAVLKSRDISFTFTNTFAYRFMALQSYAHFCFFNEITKSNQRAERMAYFVYFKLRGWKRLLLAEGPRQVINALTIKSAVERYLAASGNSSMVELVVDFLKLHPSPLDKRASFMNIVLLSMAITVFWFAVSLVQLGIAAICYIPLLCHIQGNLKEFCCHMIDRRISQLLRRRRFARLEGNEHLRLTYLEKAAHSQAILRDSERQTALSPTIARGKLKPSVCSNKPPLRGQVSRSHRDLGNSRWQLPSIQTQKAALQDWTTSSRPQTSNATVIARIFEPPFTKQIQGITPKSKHGSSLSDPFRHIPGQRVDKRADGRTSMAINSSIFWSESSTSSIRTPSLGGRFDQKHVQHKVPQRAKTAARQYSISSDTTLTSQYRTSSAIAGASRWHSLATSSKISRFQ